MISATLFHCYNKINNNSESFSRGARLLPKGLRLWPS